MKVIGHQKDDYLVTITRREIAVLLGFHSEYDDSFKKWLLTKNRGESSLQIGTEVQVEQVANFWNGVLYKEGEMATAAKTLRALADLITINMPSGIILPPAPKGEEAKS